MPRRRPVVALAVALLAVLLALPAAAAALDRAELASKLARESNRLGSASAALVVDLDTGEELYARRPGTMLVPASNEKLYTIAAALLRFTPSGTLATEVRPDPGAVIDERGTLPGDLHLVGGGDPTLAESDLRSLAARLRAAGLRRVEGGVVGDGSAFDRRRGGPDSRYRPSFDLAGWLGGLVVSHGRAFPGADPALYAARRLHAALKARGIRLGRRPRAVPAAPPATAAQFAPPLAVVESPPMEDLAAAVNVPSENFYAEMLVKALGARFGRAGSTAAGLSVVRSALAPLGVRPRLRDGSGLSRANRTSSRQLVTLLAAMDRRAEGPAFAASLPAPGQGTLRRRMRGTAAARRCRAKTGTLRGVSALSGYCTTAGGSRVAFSLLENGVWSPGAKRVEDRMVAAIARYSAP